MHSYSIIHKTKRGPLGVAFKLSSAVFWDVVLHDEVIKCKTVGCWKEKNQSFLL